jgi:hypothetical protein
MSSANQTKTPAGGRKDSGMLRVEGVTKTFYVNVVDDVSEYCDARACIYRSYDIYVPKGSNCSKFLAHELSHGFGVKGIDRI